MQFFQNFFSGPMSNFPTSRIGASPLPDNWQNPVLSLKSDQSSSLDVQWFSFFPNLRSLIDIVNKSVQCFELVDNSWSHTNAMYWIMIFLKNLKKKITYNSSKAGNSRNISRDSFSSWLPFNRLYWENKKIVLNWVQPPILGEQENSFKLSKMYLLNYSLYG